jgi:hypothetical protein
MVSLASAENSGCRVLTFPLVHRKALTATRERTCASSVSSENLWPINHRRLADAIVGS